jgi:hypothetical protein
VSPGRVGKTAILAAGKRLAAGVIVELLKNQGLANVAR